MARAISSVLADRELAARLAEGARKRAWAFTERRMASEFATVLREVVA
jgi:glycosyltransferase involved in cell wall biosynthesis